MKPLPRRSRVAGRANSVIMLVAILASLLPDGLAKFSKNPVVLDNLGFAEGSTASGGQVRKILEEPRVLDNLGFGEGSRASGGPAAGNYRFVLDGMIRNGASDFTSPRNCGGEGENHVPDAGSTIMLMSLALTVLGVGRRRSLLAKSRASLNPNTLWRLIRSNSICWHRRCKLTSSISEPTRRFTQRPKAYFTEGAQGVKVKFSASARQLQANARHFE